MEFCINTNGYEVIFFGNLWLRSYRNVLLNQQKENNWQTSG